MLANGKATRWLLIAFALVAPLIAIALIGTNTIAALAPLFLSHLLLLYATLVANSEWWGPVFSSFGTDKAEVWLTIDDGPSPHHTVIMLDLLDRFDARATFFVIGAKAEKFPHLITEILARGHSIANHTFSHSAATFWCAGPKRIAQEIDRGAETLRKTPTRPNLFFRPPVGMKSPYLHPALARRGLALIGWSVRGFDTVRRDADEVAQRIDRMAKPGAIIVLHEDHQIERDPAFGPRCLELTLERLNARSFAFIIPSPDRLRSRADGR